MRGLTQCLPSVSARLSVTSPRWVCAGARVRIHFLSKAGGFSPLWGGHVSCVRHPSVDPRAAPTSGLLWLMPLRTRGAHPFETLLSVLLGTYPEVGLLGRVDVLFLSVLWDGRAGSTVAAPFCVPAGLTGTCPFLSFSTAAPDGCARASPRRSRCVSVTIRDAQRFLMRSSAAVCPVEKCLQSFAGLFFQLY